MKNPFSFLKKIALFAGVFVALFGMQSCKEKEEDPSPGNTTPTFSLVGTWTLESAQVKFDTKEYTLTAADIAKGGAYSVDNLAFTSDGKYTRGSESGTYIHLGNSLKLSGKDFKLSNADLTSFNYGNSFDDAAGNAETRTDAFFVAQKLMDIMKVAIPGSSGNVSYRVIYKKK